MLTISYVKENVLKLLPVDSDLYSEQLDILVAGAMSKLKNEGIDVSKIGEGSTKALDYCICVSYQVAMDIDADVDHARLMQQYITRVNTLRTSICIG